MEVTTPLTQPLNASASFLCLRLDPATGSFSAGGDGYTIQSTTNTTTSATCKTSRAGTYLIAQYIKEGTQGAVLDPEDATNTTLPYSYVYTFDADYSSITSSLSKLEAFKGSIRTAVSAATNLPLANVLVKDVRQGSVVVTLELQVPVSWSAEEVSAMNDVLTKDPKSTFTSEFLSTYGVKVVELKSLDALPDVLASLKGGIDKAVAIGIGVGVGVGGALVVGIIVIVVVVRRRRMHLHSY
jgi:hypothetical protein